MNLLDQELYDISAYEMYKCCYTEEYLKKCEQALKDADIDHIYKVDGHLIVGKIGREPHLAIIPIDWKAYCQLIQAIKEFLEIAQE